jgi:hypothetical protein
MRQHPGREMNAPHQLPMPPEQPIRRRGDAGQWALVE